MKVWATPVGQAVTATIAACWLLRRGAGNAPAVGVGGGFVEEAFAISQGLGRRALVQALADETGQVHRAGADHQHPVGLGDLRRAQLPLRVLGILHFDTGAPATTLGRGGQQARSAHWTPGRWGRR
jgi:hypothetical protein